MTLCIAATCRRSSGNRMVICADKRTEVEWAGGDVGNKVDFMSVNWAVLFAGDESKALDLINTGREIFMDEGGITLDNVFEKLNEVSSTHKRKLCDRYVRQTWGISFEQFLTKGEAELTPEVRSRVFHDISELKFDCDVTVVGFLLETPFIFTIHSDGEVVRYENFAAIGTGSLIAESVLFQREQQSTDTLDRTLYNVYEAARLGRIAPGVSETHDFIVLAPPTEDDSNVGWSYVSKPGLKMLDETFKIVGPKALIDVPKITESHVHLMDQADLQSVKGLQVTLYGSKPPRQP
jgi:hypothetical protein